MATANPKPLKLRAWRQRENGKDGLKSTIMDLLCVHPAVHRAIRYNSGAREDSYIDKRGVMRRRYTWFNSAAGHSDIGGLLKGGMAFYMEVKLPGNEPTGDQQIFLNDMRAGGALAVCVHSVDEANAALVGFSKPRERFHKPFAFDG